MRVGEVGGDAVVAVVVDSVGTGVVVNILRDGTDWGVVTRLYVDRPVDRCAGRWMCY